VAPFCLVDDPPSSSKGEVTLAGESTHRAGQLQQQQQQQQQQQAMFRIRQQSRNISSTKSSTATVCYVLYVVCPPVCCSSGHSTAAKNPTEQLHQARLLPAAVATSGSISKQPDWQGLWRDILIRYTNEDVLIRATLNGTLSLCPCPMTCVYSCPPLESSCPPFDLPPPPLHPPPILPQLLSFLKLCSV